MHHLELNQIVLSFILYVIFGKYKNRDMEYILNKLFKNFSKQKFIINYGLKF